MFADDHESQIIFNIYQHTTYSSIHIKMFVMPMILNYLTWEHIVVDIKGDIVLVICL